MPLSDHEKRLLDEMERALTAEDPKLTSAFNGKNPRRSRAVGGFGLIVIGIFVLFGGLVSQLPALGIAGFVISLVGAVLAVSNLAGLVKGVKVPVAAGKKSSKWSARFEQRWDKRNFGQ